MDELDLRIIGALSKDSRTPFLEVSKKLAVSEGTVRNRVSAMLKKGVIKQFSLIVSKDANRFGGVSVLVGLKTNPHIPTSKVVSSISHVFGVQRVFEVAGSYDVFCIVSGQNMPDLNAVLEKLRGIRGVASSESFTVLNEVDSIGN